MLATKSLAIARPLLRPSVITNSVGLNRFYSTGKESIPDESPRGEWRRYGRYRRNSFIKFAIGTFFLVAAARVAFPQWFNDRRPYARDMELYTKVTNEDGSESFELVDRQQFWRRNWRRDCNEDRKASKADYNDFLEFKQWKNAKNSSSDSSSAV